LFLKLWSKIVTASWNTTSAPFIGSQVIRDRASEQSVWNYKSTLDARIHRASGSKCGYKTTFIEQNFDGSPIQHLYCEDQDENRLSWLIIWLRWSTIICKYCQVLLFHDGLSHSFFRLHDPLPFPSTGCHIGWLFHSIVVATVDCESGNSASI